MRYQTGTLRLRLLLSLTLSLLLAACGASGGDDDGGGGAGLPESAYFLDLSANLEPGLHFAPQAAMWVSTLVAAEDDEREWYSGDRPVTEGGYAVGEDGTVSARLDARLMPNADGVPALEFGRYMQDSWQPDPSMPDPTLSIPDARLHVVLNAYLFQHDVAEGWAPLHSHWLYASAADGAGSSSMFLFTDRDLTIISDADAADEAGFALNLNLRAGWNQAFEKPGTSGADPIIFESTPLSAADLFPVRNVYRSVWVGTDLGVRGFIARPAHVPISVEAANIETASTSRVFTWLHVSNWLGGAFRGLLPLAEALPGTGTLDTGDQEPSTLSVDYYVYDAAAINQDGWDKDLSLSMGRVRIDSAVGNEVIKLYSDRAFTLSAADFQPAGRPGTTWNTAVDGIRLNMGWNRIELVPVAGQTGSFNLVPFHGSWTNFSLLPVP